jgi:histidinol dehydrogenase
MNTKGFQWHDAIGTARAIRSWMTATHPERIVAAVKTIQNEVFKRRDDALRELTARFDKVAEMPTSLRVDPADAQAALASIDSDLREALEVAATNIRIVAEGQMGEERPPIELPQGQTVTVREVPVSAVGVYAPGGRAAYPSSVLMCAIPARVAGVDSISMVSPPGSDGHLSEPVLAAAALCGIEEIYAVGGAQAIFALTVGTDTVKPVDVIVGPGNLWVQEAKRRVAGAVGIDSYAGPSELMTVVGPAIDPEWVGLDLCAQAEHGPESPLIAVALSEEVLTAVVAAAEALAPGEGEAVARLATVKVPDIEAAIDLANAYAPEHLELLDEGAALQAARVKTAGCVFVGRYGATAFGDYAAGSNHVLPTSRSGRFSGPLGPGTFRRKISTVEVTAEAAAKLAPHVDRIARAEGFPVHGESAMIRSEP